ncbi:pyridoxal-phosphate dependent enzyme [Cellulomonas bogoriensis]|uniref:Pyridoxal-5'-phosphate-dependent protein subunit beta n=1 Tax=Cellulomonas bogoriensis 69B4 = DSM 16987 TaxID=1386082 RepID=A0A0A0BU21_9CELL|nr:pyridoxal-phosphate dependent enzyme [Cellulomonas bogoriensis]KGM11903.1 pyridoxal-5'-phosphate-dependent protein subunit beta [Cellulomonas bogoriensis 69B4 = DSM 16987]
MRYDSITDAIGDTPLLRIDPQVHGLENTDLYAKLELLNPFGSVKDRAAWNMVRHDIDAAARDGRTVVELSSGNTAKSLALIAGAHGLPFRSITNRMKVPEIKDLLLLIGAEIEELPGQAECLDPTAGDDPLTRIHRVLQASEGEYLHTDQYYNPRNTAAHVEGTGPEIIKDLGGQGPDVFIACVGTAGSSTGVATALREHDPRVQVVGLVAAKSDFIPGIRNIDEVHEVGLFDPATYDHVDAVSADQALDGMLTLIRRCGVLSGPTGGAAFHGAVEHLRRDDDQVQGRRTAVFIVCDRAESYLSYVRKRRPELLRRPARAGSVADVTDEQAAQVPALTVDQARQWITEARPLVVDLRGSFAYATQHLPGSVNIVDEVFDDLTQAGLPVDADQPVLLVCPVGERSARYAALLRDKGHTDARSLAGGVVAWRDAGAPMVRTR